MSTNVYLQSPNVQSYIAASGTLYNPDANGVITLSTAAQKLDAGSLIGMGCVQLQSGVKNNLAATADPGVSNDSTQDYGAGSTWLNTTGQRLWSCVSAAAGAAVWALSTVGTVAANGLVATRFPMRSLRNTDGTVLGTTGSTKLHLSGTDTAITALTTAVQHLTATAVAMMEVVLPQTYIAAAPLTLTANVQQTNNSGTTQVTGLTINAFPMSVAGAPAADICTTTGMQTFTSTSGIDMPFTLSGVGLSPGQILDIKASLTAVEGGNTGTTIAQLNSLRIG